MSTINSLNVSGYISSAHFILIIYFLASRTVSELLTYMIYVTGLLAILLLSSSPKTYSGYALLNLFILAITTFYAGAMINFKLITRWLPAVFEQVGGAISVRSNESDARRIVIVSTGFITLLLFLNLLI